MQMQICCFWTFLLKNIARVCVHFLICKVNFCHWWKINRSILIISWIIYINNELEPEYPQDCHRNNFDASHHKRVKKKSIIKVPSCDIRVLYKRPFIQFSKRNQKVPTSVYRSEERNRFGPKFLPNSVFRWLIGPKNIGNLKML